MSKISTRKLFLFGKYSLALLLPKKWLQEFGVKAGDSVQLEIDRARKRIVVRFDHTGTDQSSEQANKNDGNTTTDHGEGWQPIPQL